MSSTAPASPPSLALSDGFTAGVIHSPDIAVIALTTPPVPPGSHAGTSKWTCNRQDCNRVLSSVSHDPHSVCIKCRGFCTVASRCEECAEGDDVVVEGTKSYQSRLARHRSHYTRSQRQGNTNASANTSGSREGSSEVVMEPGSECSLSSVESVAPQAGHALPLEGQLTSLLTHSSQLQFMLSEMISS